MTETSCGWKREGRLKGYGKWTEKKEKKGERKGRRENEKDKVEKKK